MDMNEFGRLCEDHRRAVLSYAYACCRDLALAEDIVQETMLIALEKREHYFQNADFGAWLVSIARHVWFRERGRRKLQTASPEFVEANAMLVFEPELYEDEAWEEERRVLMQCIEKLSGPDRTIIRNHFDGNMKYAEIADAMKQGLSWVKVRMHRARQALRRCVDAGLRREHFREA